jgi:hypothetical protein
VALGRRVVAARSLKSEVPPLGRPGICELGGRDGLPKADAVAASFSYKEESSESMPEFKKAVSPLSRREPPIDSKKNELGERLFIRSSCRSGWLR